MASSISKVAFLIFVSILSNNIATVVARDFLFGNCEPGKESCRDCYIELVMSLFEGDGNMFNLSQAFFPPTIDAPDSVIVEYHFKNETMDSTEYWFWATSGLYFFYPMKILQFISIFFGKPTPLYERKVVVTLNASECYGVSRDYVTMLTQRLKAYVQEPNTNLKLDNSYRAVAVCKETLEDLLEDRTENMPIKLVHVFGVCPFIALALVWLLIIIILTLYLCAGKLKKKPKLNRQRKSVILSISLISSSRLVYFIILDAYAVHVRNSTLHSDLKEIFFNGKLGDYHHLLYHVPEILLSFDVISFFILLVFVMMAVAQKCWYSRPWNKSRRDYQLLESIGDNAAENQAWKENQHYYFLALIGFCLLFSVTLHAPYIITAYLNDAQHAGSIFIFYTTVTIIEFGLLQFSFNRCLEAEENRESRDQITAMFGAMSAIITPLLLYGLTVVVMFYFYFVPTDDSISSVPNQIVVSYQTVIVFIGAYIAYTSIFKKKSSLQEALREINDDWKSLTDEELLTKFYKEMITKFDKIANGQKGPILQDEILQSEKTDGANGSS